MTRMATDTLGSLGTRTTRPRVAGVWSRLSDRADPAHVATVVSAARRAVPRAGDVRVVAIDGRSGSGKTTLAAGVSAALGCPVVSMDEIFPGWDGLAAAIGLVTSEVLEPLARGARATYRRWDWASGGWGETATVAPHPFLVLEGCGSSVGTAGRYAALRVWVRAPDDLRRSRGICRDGATFAAHWERWAAQEDAVFSADESEARADIVIDTAHRG